MKNMVLSVILAASPMMISGVEEARVTAAKKLKTTEEKVISIIGSIINRDKTKKVILVTKEKSLISELGMDSLDMAEMMMDFEDVFSIKIKNNDIRFQKIKTVSELMAYVEILVKNKVLTSR